MAEEKYLLKIIAGPNVGAEIAFGEESLVIGSGIGSDLILSDTMVNEEHLKLTLNGHEIKVNQLDGKFFIGGQEIQDEEATLEPFQFLSVGTTHLVIGDLNAQWPRLTSADVPELITIAPEELPEGELSDDEEALDETSREAGEEADISQEEPVMVEEKPKLASLAKDYPLVAIPLMVLILMLIGLFSVISMQPSKPEQLAQIQADRDFYEEVLMHIKELKLGRNLEITEFDDYVFVSGWVPNNKLMEELTKPFELNVDQVVFEVINEKQVLSSVNDFFAALKVTSVNAELTEDDLGKAGIISLKGYYGKANEWVMLKEQLEDDVVGIRSIRDEVLLPEVVYPVLTKFLSDNELSDKVLAKPTRNSIVLSGSITQEKVPNLREAITEFQKELGTSIPLVNQIKIASLDLIYLDSEIQSVVIGQDGGMIITKDGKRLFEGGALNGGYIIEKITRDGVRIRKGTNVQNLSLEELL